MFERTMHPHSILVHAVMACAPLGAVAYMLEQAQVSVGSIGAPEWFVITVLSVLIIFLISIPATVTGVAEINKMYGKWHNTHTIKLAFSLILLTASAIELVMIARFFGSAMTRSVFSPFGVMVVFVNNICAWFLSMYGLKITLGRQSFGKASYVPDFFNKERPVDILKVVAEDIKEEPDIFEIIEGREVKK